jgi:hypothetical protein
MEYTVNMAEKRIVLTEVTAQKLRHLGTGTSGVVVGRLYEGVLASEPRVGERLIICRRDGDQMITTPVRRILVDPADGAIAYIQTTNSSYRLNLSKPLFQSEPSAPVEVEASGEVSETTWVEEPPSAQKRPKPVGRNTGFHPNKKP